MSAVDTRNIGRESLFLFADVQFDGQFAPARVKVRNLSAGGMMADAGRNVSTGDRLTITLRNVGEIRGIVAWVEGSRFGIAFDTPIDPVVAREQLEPAESNAPRYARPSSLRGGFVSEEFHVRRL